MLNYSEESILKKIVLTGRAVVKPEETVTSLMNTHNGARLYLIEIYTLAKCVEREMVTEGALSFAHITFLTGEITKIKDMMFQTALCFANNVITSSILFMESVSILKNKLINFLV